MNLGLATVVLRSRRIAEVADLSLRFTRSLAPHTTVQLWLVTLLPAWGFCVLLHHFTELSWWWLWPIAMTLGWFLELPFLALAGRLLFDRDSTWRDAAVDCARVGWRFVGVRVLLFVYSTLSLIVVFGPIFVLSTYCFAAEALVLERATARGALQRAKTFLRGRSGTGLETGIVQFGILLGFACLGEILGESLVHDVLDVGGPGERLLEDGGSIFALLGWFVGIPYATTFRFLAYVNERTRQDGWDVQVALLAVASERTQERAGSSEREDAA